MKVQFNTIKLNEELKRLYKVASARTSLPILNTIHIKVEDETVLLQATDLSVSLQIKMEADEIYASGECAVPANKLTSYINALSSCDGYVLLELKSKTLHIEGETNSGVSHTKIQVLPAEEFPRLVWELNTPHVVPTEDFINLLTTVRHATAKEAARYTLNGVLLKQTEESLTAVGTDSLRLCIKTHNVDGNYELEATDDEFVYKCIMPNEAVGFIAANFKDSKELELSFVENEGKIVSVRLKDLTNGVTRAHIALLEGQYVPYEQIIPEPSETVTFNKENFKEVLDRVTVFAEQNTGRVCLDITHHNVNGSNMVIKTVSHTGQSTESLPVTASCGVEIDFKKEFLMDAVNAFNCERLTLAFENGNEPTILTDADGKDTTTYILAPLRK